MLARAEAAVARREFGPAQRDADALLRSPAPAAVRRRALLVAADAAYGLGSYRVAAGHYSEFVAANDSTPEAARAAMALGWARLRQGDRHGAAMAWTAFANQRPTEVRTPLALALAAELATQSGDTTQAQPLLDRLVTQHAAWSRYGAVGQLNRSMLAIRRGDDAQALQDLDAVISTAGPAALDDRRKIRDALAAAGAEGALESPGPVGRDASALDRADSFDRFASRLLDSSRPESDPSALHGLVLVAAARRGWTDARTVALAVRLVDDFPAYPAGPPLLARVADAAATEGQWGPARQAWETLLARAPAAMGPDARIRLGEALLRTGDTAGAGAQLEQSAAVRDEASARALQLLIELHTARGDRRAALAASDRLLQEHPDLLRSAPVLLTHAKLLDEQGQHARARAVLQNVVEYGRGAVAGEAAYRLGRALSAEGQHAAAVEWYLTAAYVAERTAWEGQALLGAGQSFRALNQTKEALAAYWKLLPGRGGPDSVADRAVSGEAAYGAGEILRDADLRADALVMFQTSAHLTAGLPAERRALLAALPCATAIGDRQAAETIFRRLQQAGATDTQIAEARQALRRGADTTGEGAVGSAAPAAITH